MTMRFWILITLCVSGLSGLTQQSRQYRDLYYESAFRPKGWFFAPGATFMFPSSQGAQETRISNADQLNDTLYSGNFRPRGRFGLYLEGGRHHFTDRFYFMKHFDYGIHFKMLRGRERFDGLVKTDSILTAVENDGKFSESFAGAFFNASNIIQLSDNHWIHNSFGVNVDYRIISRRSYEGPNTGMPWEFPDPLQAQIHYKLGWGWKADPGLYVLVSAETPILNVYPFDDGRSTYPYFSSRYRPLIFSVRIMFLDKTKTPGCENQPGQSQDVDKEKPGRHKGGDLFGPDIKGRKRRR